MSWLLKVHTWLSEQIQRLFGYRLDRARPYRGDISTGLNRSPKPANDRAFRDVVNIVLRQLKVFDSERFICIVRGGGCFFTIDIPKHGRRCGKAPKDTAARSLADNRCGRVSGHRTTCIKQGPARRLPQRSIARHSRRLKCILDINSAANKSARRAAQACQT